MDFKQKFEPKGRKLIHGAGQSPETFERYWQAVEENKPLISMVYIRINEIKIKMKEKLGKCLQKSDNLIPQIGLNLKVKKEGSKCAEISKGVFDDEIIELCNILNQLGRPVFIRIGYEFNESGKYNPFDFILAWKYIVDMLRKYRVDNVATIWCACTAFNRDINEIMVYYPGDDYVDWFGNDLFGVKHFKDNKDRVTEDFCKEAERHKKPLMIGESTATRVGVLDGEKSWKGWFEPFFKWIKTHKVVKAFCYINWDWAKDWKTPEWGNCRIEENEIIKKKYAAELNDLIYIHNLPIKQFFKKVYN